MAGIKNKYTMGAIVKSESMLAKPLSNMLYPPELSELIIHKKQPVIVRNTPIAIYPASEVKKLFISLMNKVYTALRATKIAFFTHQLPPSIQQNPIDKNMCLKSLYLVLEIALA